MRHVLLAAVLAAGLRAAAIRGVAVDNLTGRPLARATIVAQPIAGTPGTPQSVRADLDGVFDLAGLADGAWLLVASRRGFAPTRHRAVAVAGNTEAAVTIRLRRFGAITGTVLDENDVGLQEHDVVAYRNALPLVIAARAKTDDRGVYRLEGLEPGWYLVRSVGREYDEGSFLPTFSREVLRFEEARPVQVRYDGEIGNVDIRPFQGSHVSLAGRVFGGDRAVLTLISDVGRLTAVADAGGMFRFPPVPPGAYEVYAQGRNVAAWQRIELHRDVQDLRITLAPYPEFRLAIEDANGAPIEPASVPILVRHRDLAGEGKPEPLRAQGPSLPPGRWELSLAPTPSWYAVSPAGWTELLVTPPGPVHAKFVLSNRPAALRGTVRDASREPVAGVPVHLGALRTVLTDVRGRYEFYGLAPGAYRVLASFDADTPGDANSVAVNLEEGQERSLDLDLHVIR